MSAWIVDKHHIDLLVRAALHYGRSPGEHTPQGLSWWRVDADGSFDGWNEVSTYRTDGDDHKRYVTPDELGQMLVMENVASVSYRYSEPPTTGNLPGPTDCYYLEPYTYQDPHRLFTPAEVFKAINCYDYQSCEHPTWQQSEAYAFCTALRQAACTHVEGYAEAPWGFSSAAAETIPSSRTAIDWTAFERWPQTPNGLEARLDA